MWRLSLHHSGPRSRNSLDLCSPAPAQPVRRVGPSASSLGPSSSCAPEDTAGERPTHLSLRTFYRYFSAIFKFQFKKAFKHWERVAAKLNFCFSSLFALFYYSAFIVPLNQNLFLEKMELAHMTLLSIWGRYEEWKGKAAFWYVSVCHCKEAWP